MVLTVVPPLRRRVLACLARREAKRFGSRSMNKPFPPTERLVNSKRPPRRKSRLWTLSSDDCRTLVRLFLTDPGFC